VDGMDALDGFHFDYDSVLNDQIDAIAYFQFLTLVDNRQWNFDGDFEPPTS